MATVAIDARDAAGPQLRGWGVYVRELVAALRRRANGVEVVALADGGPGPELVFEQLRLPRALRRIGADAVHAPNCFLPLRRPCAGVVTINDLAFEAYPEDFAATTGWKFRTFAARAARSAEIVICPSRATADDVCERYGADPARVRVILDAPALPSGHEPPPPGPYFLAVGDLRRKKNLVRLVRAFAAARAEGIGQRLVLAGPDAGEATRIRAAAGDAPVQLTGFVSDARLDALIRGADALVYPSLHEGFGLAVVEAMARGTAVACSNATSLPEAAGGAALLFDPLDEDAIAAALVRLARDGELRADLERRGRRRAAELSWERTAEQTAAAYAEAIEAR